MQRKHLVKDILKNHKITSWYQPIVNIESRTLVGWEAFSRGPETNDSLPRDELFDSAAEAGILKPFDLMCIQNAALCFEQLQLEPRLFINLTNEMLVASSRLKKQVVKMIAESAIPPARMVLEIDEKNASHNTQDLIEAVNYFHKMGFEIAFDHLSGMGDISEDTVLHELWAQLKPDYIKLDQGFIKNIHGSPAKQNALKKLVAISRSQGSQLIAEGVETEKELKKLYELGVYSVQGFLIQAPELAPVPPKVDDLLDNLLDEGAGKGRLAADLVVSKNHVESSATIEEVYQLFEQQVHINSLAVVDDHHVKGMVFRRLFMTKYAKKQRREVVKDKSITKAMTQNFLKVEADQRIEQVSRLVTTRAQLYAEHDFIICNHERFLGIGTVIDLLRKITQLRVQPDHQENILTMLPGNTPLARCVNELLEQGKDFSIALLDLTNFKAFNNQYSHYAGDQMLIMFADILRKHVLKDGNFAGHIGGDDFILVMPAAPWENLLNAIFTEFKHKVLGFYPEKDIERGGTLITDLDGNEELLEFVSLSAGVLSIHQQYFDHFQTVLADLIKLKPYSKSAKGVCLAHQSEQGVTRFVYEDTGFVDISVKPTE
jgi:EAL domain-containing protein (putative c-di-GMP-specific phosphodiesterase class I)/GGDEF domain-containing protein